MPDRPEGDAGCEQPLKQRPGCGLPVPAAPKRSSATPPSKNPPTGKTTHRERGHRKSRALRRPPQRPQSPAHGGPGVAAQQAPERVHEREHEQQLEEPGRAGREVPHLLAHKRPERLRTLRVLAVRDVSSTGSKGACTRRAGSRAGSAGPSRTAADALRSSDGALSRPAIRRKRPGPNRQATPSTAVRSSTTPSGHLVVRLELPRPVDPYFPHARRAAALD